MIGIIHLSMTGPRFAQRWRDLRAAGIRQVLRGIESAQADGYAVDLDSEILASALVSMMIIRYGRSRGCPPRWRSTPRSRRRPRRAVGGGPERDFRPGRSRSGSCVSRQYRAMARSMTVTLQAQGSSPAATLFARDKHCHQP
jgi:hypothetical protein